MRCHSPHHQISIRLMIKVVFCAKFTSLYANDTQHRTSTFCAFVLKKEKNIYLQANKPISFTFYNARAIRNANGESIKCLV